MQKLFITKSSIKSRKTSIIEKINHNILRSLLFSETVKLPNISRALFWFFCGGLIFYFVCYIIQAIRFITCPFQLDYGEGYVLYIANTLAQGNTIYSDISNYPFIPSLYSPIYPLVISPFIKIFGLSYIPGRTISVISAIIIGIILFKIVAMFSEKKIAILSSLLFFASTYVFFWTALVRVDTLGLLFSISGIYFFLKYENSKLIYLSIPLFLLAFFTKQSFLIVPLASFIYLFFKNKLSGFKFGGLFAACLISIFLLLNYLTDGQFYLHMITYQGLSPTIEWTIKRYTEFLNIHFVIFIFALISGIYCLIKKEHKLLPVYFLLSAGSAITVGRPGAVGNYFLELIAVSCILSVILIKRLSNHIWKGTPVGLIVIVILLLQLSFFAHTPFSSMAEDRQTNEQVTELIRNSQGEILSEDAGLVVLNNKQLYIEWFMDTHLALMGLWDQSPFIKDLENKKFNLIILKMQASNVYAFLTLKINSNISELQEKFYDNQRYTPEMMKAIADNYHIEDRIGEFLVYKPN